MFSCVASMHVRENQLIHAIPFVCDCHSICLTCFIVQHLICYCDPPVLQMLHDCIVCRDAVSVVSRLESIDEYHVGLVMVCHHDVLVSALSADGEVSTVVSVQCCYYTFKDMEFVDWIAGFCHWCWLLCL